MEPELPPESSPPVQPVLDSAPASTADPLPTAPPAPDVSTYRDRSTGLVIFGVGLIILGVMAALMVPFAVLGMFMSRLVAGGGMHPGQFISSVAVYVFASAAFISLGIGSIQLKRWAHSLTLVFSWYWLLTGLLMTVLMTAVLPVTMRSALQAQHNASQVQSANISTGVMAVILTIVITIPALFLVAVPIALIVFYSRRDVAETCHHRDPVQRWTDRAPLPVLGASVVLAVQALYLLLTGIGTPLFPFFGRYLYGIAGFACFLIVAALDAYIAVALFRLKSSGWWIAVLTIPIRLFSMTITYSRADLMQAYSKMGWSQEQLRILNSNPMFHGHVILWWSLLSVVILYGYLLWLRRYFKSQAARPQAEVLSIQTG